MRLKFAAIGETPAFACGTLADPTVPNDNIERDKFREALPLLFQEVQRLRVV